MKRSLTLGSAFALIVASALPLSHSMASAGVMPTAEAAASTAMVVSNLNDSGPSSLRAALEAAGVGPAGVTTHITFAVTGTIRLASALPEIHRPVILDGTSATGYSAGGAPVVGVDFAGHEGLRIVSGAGGSQVLALALGGAKGDGVAITARKVTLAGNYVGLTTRGGAAPNGRDGIRLGRGSDGSVIGTNPQTSSAWVSNVVSHNVRHGILIEGSSRNTVVANRIGVTPAGTSAAGNGGHGIVVRDGARHNLIGGREYVDEVTGVSNNPTGSEGKVTPTFTRPPMGNVVSGNAGAGIVILRGGLDNVVAGNFVGTSASGVSDVGNGSQGILLDHAHRTQVVGCKVFNDPFVYYNVVSGNGSYGIEVRDSNNVAIQGNFFGTGSDNATIVANDRDGMWINGTSANTQVGGVIPLGNVSSGNGHNGIAVTGSVTGFVSFNTFAGLVAFGGAAPNGRHGIYVNADGGNNLIRTTVTSGNSRSGIKLAGNTTGVTIDPVLTGLNTRANGPLANGGDGITISGRAHHNVVGGTRKSVMPHSAAGGNVGFGIRIEGRAHHNRVFDTYVGVAATGLTAVPNGAGGIYVAGSANHNLIGGKKITSRKANIISGNQGNGITLDTGTYSNTLFGNYVGVTRFGMLMPNTGLPIVNGGKANIIINNVTN